MTTCNVCKGNGWVDSKYHGPSVCPLCKGAGESTPVSARSDKQTKIWEDLSRNFIESDSDHAIDARLEHEVKKFRNKENFVVLVHLLFHAPVVPQGGALYYHVAGKLPGQKLSADKLRSMGYLLESDGKIKTINDIPIGPVYLTLQHWGGEIGFKQWSMAKPIELDPNRKGNPLFMDENMVAFRAHYVDDARLFQSLKRLYILLKKGCPEAAMPPVGLLANILLADAMHY